MKKNKILIIDLEYCFENANTMIVERIANLLQLKYNVDVATYDIGSTNRLKNRNVDVIKIPYYSLRKSKNTANLGVSDAMRLGLYYLKKKITKSSFDEKDVKYFVNEMDKNRLKGYCLIISISCPFTSHVVASILSKKYSLPWIAYYLDPFFSKSTFNKRGLSKRKKFEEKVVNTANIIMLTYPTNKDYIDRKFEYTNRMIKAEMPGIHTEMYVGCKKDHNFPIQCYFIGNLYADIRNPKWVIKLFDYLEGVAELSFVGGYYGSKKVLNAIKGKNIHYLGKKKQEELMGIYKEADVLINIGNLVTNQMPSKIFEYISLGKPIINIYKNKKCPTLEYTKKYPICIDIYEEDIKSNISEVAQVVKGFFQKYTDLSVSREEIDNLFDENRDSSVANRLISEIERLI